MEIIFQPKAIEDVAYWKKSGNTIIQNRIQNLLLAITENPFTGIGKPEPLKHQFAGMWSRRINRAHRIIYEVNDNTVHIFSLRDHYE